MGGAVERMIDNRLARRGIAVTPGSGSTVKNLRYEGATGGGYGGYGSRVKKKRKKGEVYGGWLGELLMPISDYLAEKKYGYKRK